MEFSLGDLSGMMVTPFVMGDDPAIGEGRKFTDIDPLFEDSYELGDSEIDFASEPEVVIPELSLKEREASRLKINKLRKRFHLKSLMAGLAVSAAVHGGFGFGLHKIEAKNVEKIELVADERRSVSDRLNSVLARSLSHNDDTIDAEANGLASLGRYLATTFNDEEALLSLLSNHDLEIESNLATIDNYYSVLRDQRIFRWSKCFYRSTSDTNTT